MENSWYILGAGAIGTLWTSKFTRACIPCTLLQRVPAKPVAFEAQAKLTLTEVNGDRVNFAINQQLIAPPLSIDKLIICTKSYQTLDALKTLQPYLNDGAAIVILQNGMGQHELAAKLLPQMNILGASTTDGAMLEKKLHVKHAGNGHSLFGSYFPERTIPCDVLEELTAIGMQYHGNIQQVLWQKLMLNCVINPLTAIHQCTNGELASTADYHDMLSQLSIEVDKITQALGFQTAEVSTLERVIEVAKATWKNYSSMQQDIKYQRKTEIDFINGYLQQQADLHGIKLELNPTIIDQIKHLEAAVK